MVPFSSARKSMATVIKIEDGILRCHSKGASEIVLKRCTTLLNNQGEIVDLTPERVKQLESLIGSMAENALRTICLGYRDTNEGFFLLLLFPPH